MRPLRRVRCPRFVDEIRAGGIAPCVCAYSLRILCPEGFSAPRLGTFNQHPGLLPEYVGLHVVSWAILRGETSHGVTLHCMTAEVDGGPVFACERFPSGDDDSVLQVFQRCLTAGRLLAERVLEAAVTGRISATHQDSARCASTWRRCRRASCSAGERARATS